MSAHHKERSPLKDRGLLSYFWSTRESAAPTSLDETANVSIQIAKGCPKPDTETTPPLDGGGSFNSWLRELQRALANLTPHVLTLHDLEVYESAFANGEDPEDIAHRILSQHITFDEEF